VTGLAVVDYDVSWPLLFETLRSPVWSVVADVAGSIEHVGSTSVPGLAARPVIDIDVVAPRIHMATAIARLTTLGYEHRGDLGVPQREAFRRPPGWPPHHLYLCPTGSTALANHVAVRDYLRARPPAARAYGDLKKRLALEYARDIDGYVEAKTGFLLEVLRKSGFAEGRLAEIERVNRRP
jgi:GrpB-like predicted nucleotidyltransferase (UPF0157 family)